MFAHNSRPKIVKKCTRQELAVAMLRLDLLLLHRPKLLRGNHLFCTCAASFMQLPALCASQAAVPHDGRGSGLVLKRGDDRQVRLMASKISLRKTSVSL